MADKKDVKELTARDMEIMAKAWNCMVEEPKVDYEKLAAECGMTNTRSASNAWAAIKKKIMAKRLFTAANGSTASDDGAGAATPKATPTPRKRGKKAAAEGDDEEGASPAKKAKGGKGKAKGKAAKSEDNVEDDGDEGAKGASPVKGEPEDDGI